VQISKNPTGKSYMRILFGGNSGKCPAGTNEIGVFKDWDLDRVVPFPG
jgi:hypothetical protein